MKEAPSSSPLTDTELVSRVKARLYPLTPLTQFLEWLIERLPRKRVAVHLTPQSGVVEIDDKAGEYKGIAEEPCLQVEVNAQFAKGGWFYLVFNCKLNRYYNDACIV